MKDIQKDENRSFHCELPLPACPHTQVYLNARKNLLYVRKDLHDFAFSFKGWQSNYSRSIGSAQEIEDSEDTSSRLSRADAEPAPRLLTSAWTKSELITQQSPLSKSPALPGLGYMPDRSEQKVARCVLAPKLLHLKWLGRPLCCSTDISSVFGIADFCSYALCFGEPLSQKSRGLAELHKGDLWQEKRIKNTPDNCGHNRTFTSTYCKLSSIFLLEAWDAFIGIAYI